MTHGACYSAAVSNLETGTIWPLSNFTSKDLSCHVRADGDALLGIPYHKILLCIDDGVLIDTDFVAI